RQVRADKANVAYLHAGVKPSFRGRVRIAPCECCTEAGAASAGCLFGLLHDVEQLHVKNERGTWLDARRRAALAIGELGRTDEAALTANVHVLYSFRPALDDPF